MHALMLCTLLDEPFDHPEREWRIWSRNAKLQNRQFPEVAAALKSALKRTTLPAVLDGEIVCLDESGKSSFKKLQQRFRIEDTHLPLFERKQMLHSALSWNQVIRPIFFIGLRPDKNPEQIRKEVPRGTRGIQKKEKLRKNARTRRPARSPKAA